MIELDDSIGAIVAPDHLNHKLWEITRERLRQDLLSCWLWQTVEAGDEKEWIGVDDLWAAWAQMWGVEPDAEPKHAGGYPRRVWTQRIATLPSPSGPALGDREGKKVKGQFRRVWHGWRFRRSG